MAERKIRDLSGIPFCNSLEHNPPAMVVRDPGIYEHVCPVCKKIQVFVVRPKFPPRE